MAKLMQNVGKLIKQLIAKTEAAQLRLSRKCGCASLWPKFAPRGAVFRCPSRIWRDGRPTRLYETPIAHCFARDHGS